MESNQLYLFKERRFLPLFITQYAVCFNDNLIKNALVILVTYRLAEKLSLPLGQMILLANAVFITPYLLFSGISGQLADKFERSTIIKYVKGVEIFIAIFAMYGFHIESLIILYSSVCLLGIHSTFFGPVKYSILPDHLTKEELLSANGYIEAATFIGILLGTLLGGLYTTWESFVMIVILATAVAGFVSSLYIPMANNSIPDLKINYNLWQESVNIVKHAASKKTVFLCILGISWFWFIGAAFLSEIPILSKEIFCANEYVANLFLATFSIGVGIGSFWCSRIFENEVTARYVPVAAVGLSIFSIDLYFACGTLAPSTCNGELYGLWDFLSQLNNLRILFDLFFISAISGIYVVPLYAVMQYFSAPNYRSRIIAANNIISAIFMIASSLTLSLLFSLNFSVPTVILFVSIINLIVAVYIAKMVPETTLFPQPLIMAICRFLIKKLYRVEVKGLEHFKNAGDKALIISNHISYMDPPIIASFLSDKIVFAVDAEWAKKWWMKHFVMKVCRSYPIDRNNPMAMKSLINELRRGKKVAIFPEGRLTETGGIMKIYDGPGVIADKAGAVLLPVRVDGMEHTCFSKMKHIPRLRIFPKVTLTVLPPVELDVPEEMGSKERRKYLSTKLYDIMCDIGFESSNYRQTLFQSLLDSAKIYGYRKKIAQDLENNVSYRSIIARSFILGNEISKDTISGEYVGVMLPNAVATMITFFAMHASGRIPAMLNFTSGEGNVLSACETLRLRTIYTSKKFIEKAELENLAKALEKKYNVIYLEDLKSRISILDKVKYLALSFIPSLYYNSFLWNDLDCENPAVALFTSGTEGAPKAVILSHKNIQSNWAQVTARFDFDTSNVAFNALPLFHCFGMTGMFLMMKNGIRSFFYPSPLHYRQIPEIIYDLGATILFSTDTFLNGYAKYADQYDFYSMRYIIAGAEKLKPETRKLWFDRFGVRILEGYGVTEASPVISANSLMHEKPCTVGRFMPQIQYKLEPVEGLDEGGLLWIKGPNVMMGYVKPKKPAEIVPLKDGWYNTGDIVNVDSEGYIKILGRQKRFAKIGGEMVSLSVVEELAVKVHKEESHAAMHMMDPKKGEQIILFTTSKKVDRDSIKSALEKRGLAAIYLPKHFVLVKEIPVLATGKTNYRKLLEMTEEFIKKEGK